jgi:hypothetical protein
MSKTADDVFRRIVDTCGRRAGVDVAMCLLMWQIGLLEAHETELHIRSIISDDDVRQQFDVFMEMASGNGYCFR